MSDPMSWTSETISGDPVAIGVDRLFKRIEAALDDGKFGDARRAARIVYIVTQGHEADNNLSLMQP